MSRRSSFKIGTSLPLVSSLPLADHLSQLPTAAEDAHAKSILLIWLLGAPSHLDLFAPKPFAPIEYRGPFAAFDTRIPGAQFTELVPELALRSHRFALVRTNIKHNGNHRPAGWI